MKIACADYLAQICTSIGLSGDSLVALTDLEFYGDAAGTFDRSNVALGGYIATVDDWTAFRKPWRKMLDQEGVECFHRTDMEPPFHGEFKRKGWTKPHQILVLRELHQIIKKHTIRGIGHAVKNAAFSQLMPTQVKRQYGGPYGWCVLLEVVEVGLWARRRKQWVHYFFEAGDAGQPQANATLKRLYDSSKYRELFRIGGWSFVPKTAVIQIQPADFIAFEAYKDIDNFLKGSRRAARKSRKNLIRPKCDELRLWADYPITKWLARLADMNGDVIETLITTDPNS